jgi:hypothetical protein
MILFLSRSDPLAPEFSPFMLDAHEVIDSPSESPKCVCTQNEQEAEALAQNRANRRVRWQLGASSTPARTSFSRPSGV